MIRIKNIDNVYREEVYLVRIFGKNLFFLVTETRKRYVYVSELDTYKFKTTDPRVEPHADGSPFKTKWVEVLKFYKPKYQTNCIICPINKQNSRFSKSCKMNTGVDEKGKYIEVVIDKSTRFYWLFDLKKPIKVKARPFLSKEEDYYARKEKMAMYFDYYKTIYRTKSSKQNNQA